jgi:DNA-directed RNA polymerase II subunit RPB11
MSNQPGDATFLIKNADHTIGNILRTQLLNDSRVDSAGYYIQHPSENDLIIRIQTSNEIDPREVLADAIKHLINTTEELKNNFDKEVVNWYGQTIL